MSMSPSLLITSTLASGEAPQPFTWYLPPSKSLLARQLVLASLEGRPLPTDLDSREDLPQDIHVLLSALRSEAEGVSVISVGESGTAMRFMTAYLSAKATRSLRLEGTARQHERPIAPLVEAMRQLGAKIHYLERVGYPPLSIEPAVLHGGRVTLDASHSSQYLSALLLLAPILQERVEISLTHPLVSAPYALMTQAVLQGAGYPWVTQEDGAFTYDPVDRIEAKQLPQLPLVEEADWSAASYAYALISLLPIGAECRLPRLMLPSPQGDSLYLPSLFEALGVTTEVGDGVVRLRKVCLPQQKSFHAHLSSCPDLVPALVAALVGNDVAFRIEGIGHLRIKESDRLGALASEFLKLHIPLCVEADALSWNHQRLPSPTTSSTTSSQPSHPPQINPHQDHRIAMALALMAVRVKQLCISSPDCVKKSFPSYWEQLREILCLQMQ
ncbi:hypothetical protein [Porphyromonas catoniae]|uniref:3-phosphoshikimate 1-carboxyvinyltransferase n=1 Tax=Porphyromonas catoniae TaxID=41976 RepID=UPI0028D38FD6|nr:hypothetical protein [Porphyromonas catoniae]